MQPNAEAKNDLPVSEAKIWRRAFLAVGAIHLGAILLDLYFQRDLHAAVPGRAGYSFGILLAWGGYHLISRRASDISALHGVSWPIVVWPPREILACFLVSLSCTALALLLGGIGIRSFENAAAESAAKKKAKPSPSDHPLYDADLDGATGAGGATGRIGRG